MKELFNQLFTCVVLVSLRLALWPPYWERAVQPGVHLCSVGYFEVTLVATVQGKSCTTSCPLVLVSVRLFWWPPYWERAVRLAVHLCYLG